MPEAAMAETATATPTTTTAMRLMWMCMRTLYTSPAPTVRDESSRRSVVHSRGRDVHDCEKSGLFQRFSNWQTPCPVWKQQPASVGGGHENVRQDYCRS